MQPSNSNLTLIRNAHGSAHALRFVCLIVDGTATDQRELAGVIEADGLEVVTADSAEEALRILGQRRIDIVLAEEYLPHGAGSTLLETIRHRWPTVGRVLVGRELGSDVVIQAVNRARVQRVLYKKMSALTLRAEVEAALNETLLERGSMTRGGRSSCG